MLKMGWCHLWIKLQKKMIAIPIPKEKLVPLIRNWYWLHAHVVTFETRVAHISYILLQFHSIVYEATLPKKQQQQTNKSHCYLRCFFYCATCTPITNLHNARKFDKPAILFSSSTSTGGGFISIGDETISTCCVVAIFVTFRKT